MPTLSMDFSWVPPAAAVTFHELILRRVEVDHLVLPGICLSTISFWTFAFYRGVISTAAVYLSFFGTLTIWILLYRGIWHPLRRYPGPRSARLSKLWTVKQTWDSKWHWHRVQQSMQRKYGDYVRTGPREITIFDPAAIQPLLGFSSTTTKGPFYDVMEKSLHLNRDKAFHRQRRRVWDNGMKESLSSFAPIVDEFTDKLLAQLRKDEGRPIDLLKYCTYYSYDIMAKLAFGDSMGFIEGYQSDVAAKILNFFASGLDAMGLMYHMPWLMNALGVVTSVAGPMKQWTDWSVSQMKNRIARPAKASDFVGHLLSNTPQDAAGLELLYGESRLIISAGSETTSTALTFVFMQLATHPEYIQAIRNEFRQNASNYHCQRPLPLLDAVIQESMRLWPSVYFGSQRVTPPSGLHINNHFIPGNTIVQIPPFAMFHDSRNFVKPDDFVPERWTTRNEMVLNKNAFIPFSTGPYNCVGKTLANMELRSVIAKVVNEFDIVLPSGFMAETYWENIKDHFTAGPPPQDVSFVTAT